MSVTEVKEALGQWNLRLRRNTPRELLDTVSSANYFGHIALIPGRGFNVAAAGDGLLAAARYVGVFRARFNQDDEYELKGVGMTMWLGNEDQAGDVFTSSVAVASAGFSTAITAVLPPGGSVTAGTLYNVGASGTYTGSFRWQTPREAIGRICNVFTMDTADPVEFRVNGDGTLDAGKASQLYNTTNPTTMLVRRDPGRDLTLVGLDGSLSLDSDVEDYATKIIVFGEGDGDATAVGTATGPASPFKDIHGNPVVMVKMLNEPDASAASVGSVAAVAMSKVVNSRSAAQLSTDEYDVKGTLKVGDALYVYDVENGFFDNTRQAVWQGQTINPILLRCTELTFPIPAGWTVAFRDRNGGWWDLSDYYAPEQGSTSVVVGEFLQRLGGSGRDPLNGRPTPDSSVPDTPVFGPFFTASYLADSGQTRSQIQATWTRPLNTDRSVITDGDHYEVRWRPDAANAYAATWDELSLYPWPSGTGLSTLFGTDATVPTKVGNPVELNTYEAQVTSRALFSYLETELEAVVGTPLKDAVTGLGARGTGQIGASAANYGFCTVDSGYWDQLQPTSFGPIDTSSTAWNDLQTGKASGLPIRWRLFAGDRAPAWAKALGGGAITLCQPSDGTQTFTIGRFWTTAFQDAWQDFLTKIATLVDSDNQIREIAAHLHTTDFAEPNLLQLSTTVASAGPNIGKNNMQVFYEAGLDPCQLSGGSPIAPGANSVAALEYPYAIMPDGQNRWRTMGFKKTRYYMPVNPVQTYRVTSTSPFAASLITNPANWVEGTQIPNFVTRLGAQGILANNSLRVPLSFPGAKYPSMYQAMTTADITQGFQTATQSNINTAAASLGIAAGHDATKHVLDVAFGITTTANDPLGEISAPVSPGLRARSVELPTGGISLFTSGECATWNVAASANFVRNGVSTGALLSLYHSRNGNDLPANWTASNASADASGSLHSLAEIKMRSKMDLLAAQDGATIATVAAFVGTIPSNGLTKYLVFEPEPELAVAAGTYTAATWREAAATFCKAVLDNRGTKPIHPVICLRGDTFDGTTSRNPSDYNVVTSLLARGVSMSQVVFAQNAYSDAPGAAVGSVQAKLNQAFVSAQVWGFRRFGLNDVGVKTYDLDDRLAAPTWLQSLNAFIKNWHCEFVSWASSDQQSTAGLEGYYWTYSASAQLEIAQIAQDGATIGGSGGVSLLTWQQPIVPPIAGVDFTTQLVGWDVNNVVVSELTPGQRYEFQIRAADNASPPNLSQWSASSFQRAALDTSGPSQPAAPLVASSRIAVQITHDLGLASGGAYNLDLDLDHLEIHAGGESFSPSPETLLGRSRANAAMLQARVPVVATYNVEATGPLFIRVVAVDKTGNKSAASPSASASALLIDDAHISDLTVTKVTAGTIAADWIIGAKVGTAPDGARAEMTPTGFAAYNADNVKTFSADNNGNVTVIGTLTSGPVNRRLSINPDGNDPTIRFYPDTGGDYALIAGYTADAEGNKPTSQDSWISMSSSLGSLSRRAKLVLSSDTVGTTFASRAWMSAGVSDAGTVRGGTLDLVDATDDNAKYASMQVWGGAGTVLSRLWASGGNLYFDGLTAYFDTFATSTMFRCGLFGFNGTTAHTFSYTNTLGTLPYPVYAIKASASIEHRLSAMSTTGFTVTTNVAVPANTDVIAWVAQ